MRNFIYNKSDIIVALLIIAAALVIIFFRVNAIMDFGDSATKTLPSTSTEESTGGGDGDDAPADAENEKVDFDIKPGDDLDTIAENLEKAGLITSLSEFKDEVAAQEAEENLTEGTYSIPKGAGIDDIVLILNS